MKFSLITPLFASFAVFSPMLAAQTAQPAGVHNFYQLNETVFRGAQPTAGGFQSLAKLGVKTIIDLRGGGHRSLVEKKEVEAAGMRYVNIPLSGHFAPSAEEVTKLLSLLNDKSAGPVFVHCRRGADRTGTIIACYRISHDHWQNEKALQEAKADGMSWTEIAMKHYVLGYKATVEPNTEVVAAARAGTAAQ